MATTTRHMTIEEFARIDEPGRFDLIDGVLLQMPPAGGEHGEINSHINRLLGNHVVNGNLGYVYTPDTGFILSRNPETILCPDVAFVREDRLPPREERRGFLELAPDLAVEVVSPSDSNSEVTAKVMTYLEAGTQLVWVVEPTRRTVTVYTPDRHARLLLEHEEIDGGNVLPDFHTPISEFFR